MRRASRKHKLMTKDIERRFAEQRAGPFARGDLFGEFPHQLVIEAVSAPVCDDPPAKRPSKKRQVAHQVGASYAVLTEDEKNLGVCLVDIGAGTTDIAVFHKIVLGLNR